MRQRTKGADGGKGMPWWSVTALLGIGLSIQVSLACCQTVTASPNAEDYAGLWEAPDHRAILEGAPCANETRAFCLRIVWIPDPGLDTENRQKEFRSRALCGLEIARYLRFVAPKWRLGSVYDPNDGRLYDSSLNLRDGRLLLRGFIKAEVFGETETYTRVAKLPAPCGEKSNAKAAP